MALFNIPGRVAARSNLSQIPVEARFAVSGRSVIGRNHLGTAAMPEGLGNQDAFGFIQIAGFGGVAIVCDGCSGGKNSRTGADFIIDFSKQWLGRNINSKTAVNEGLLSKFMKHLCAAIKDVATSMQKHTGVDFNQVLEDHFLVSIVLAFVGPKETSIWCLGDGVYGINGDYRIIDPVKPHSPAYLAFHLYRNPSDRENSRKKMIQRYASIATNEIYDLMIGSDGMWRFQTHNKSICVDGEPLGDLKQFMGIANKAPQDGRILLMRGISVQLTLEPRIVSREKVEVVSKEQGGVLKDDATFINVTLSNSYNDFTTFKSKI